MEDDITQHIQRVNANEPGAHKALFEAAYSELHQLARSRLRDCNRHLLLDPEELVHESYLRFIHGGQLQGRNRRAFFAYASCIMRSVIVDLVRERLADRRGGDCEHTTLDDEAVEAVPNGDDDQIWVREALDTLAAAEPRLAQVVHMRYFGGYSEVEIGKALRLTERTVRRDWDRARGLLSTMLKH
jgi:RNA polymerase sigma factor (TIGR02999 family)